MTLSKDLFVKLSFHAKMHRKLDYGRGYTDREHSFREHVTEEELQRRIHEEIDSTTARIEEKELEGATQELQGLKDLVHKLRSEFDAMKKE